MSSGRRGGVNEYVVLSKGATDPRVRAGSGSPETVVTGSVGDLWLRIDGGPATAVYYKGSGTATTAGWIAIGPDTMVVTAIQTSLYSAACGECVRVDPSSGGFPVNLPAISAANAGCVIEVKNVTTSTNKVTVDAAGADTIDGLATLPLAEARGGIKLRSDGVSEWMVV